ncbi:hypothetical protein OPT61_g8909 [Boeremia exigua]|uniref:Uncharacterized protein n=1 Tax=Boeremia exigua TaxID=749465 RepID=A0ACC2HWJ7_9PLEO|nr:hypothetical protein OPT61_g8909 [Boeremia exigua]
MEILGLIARLKRRKGKLGVFGKILLFNEDSGVTDALATLETLVADFVHMQIPVIGKDLSKAAKDIRDLKEDTRQNTMALSRIEHYQIVKHDDDGIRAWLQLQDNTLPYSRHLRLREECVKNTGAWLVESNRDFSQWVNEHDSSPVLLVTGGAGRGKTFLASCVIDYIHKHVHSSASSRRVLAYHYIQDDSDKKNLSQMYSTLQSIVWQLAKSDENYYNFVVQKRKQIRTIEGAKHLWETVMSSYEPEQDTTMFLVVDGLRKVTAEDLNPVAQVLSYHQTGRSQRLQFRLFATTTENAREITGSTEVTKILLDPGFTSRSLPPNIEDVKRLVIQRLATSPIFQEELTKARILKKLQKHVQNDFPRLDLVVRELGHCNNSRQLGYILRRLEESMPIKVGRHIKSLNQKFSSDEISEINAILTCIGGLSYNNRYISVHVVEQFINLMHEFRFFSSVRQQIEKQYHALFWIDSDDDINWRHQHLESYLVNHSRDERKLQRINEKRGKVNLGWDPEEVDLLEKVVETNFSHVFGPHGKELFAKYGFSDFFASKRGQHKAYIKLDRGQSRVKALQLCLQVLRREADDSQVQHLHRYTRKGLFHLLKRAKPKYATQKQCKAIARLASELFQKDSLIDAWSQNERWSESMRCIFDEPEVLRCWTEAQNMNKADDDGNDDDMESDDGSSGDDSSDVDSSDNEDLNSAHRLLPINTRFFDHVTGRLIYFLDSDDDHDHDDDKASPKLPRCEPESIRRTLKDTHSELDNNEIVRLLVERVSEEPESSWGQEEQHWALAICVMYLDRDPDNWWAALFVANEFMKTSRVKEAEQLVLSATLSSKIKTEHAESYWQRLVPLRERCQSKLNDLAGLLATYTHIMQECPERSLNTLTFQKLVQLGPAHTMEMLTAADQHTVLWNPHQKWSQQLVNGITGEGKVAYLLTVAFYENNLEFTTSLLETALGKRSDMSNDSSDDGSIAPEELDLELLKSALATILWNSSSDATARERALGLWTEANDYEAILTVLLQQARIESPDAPLKSPSAQRLAGLMESLDIGSATQFRYQLVVAHCEFRSGQGEKAGSDVLALLDRRDYHENEPSALTSAQLEDLALACFALGQDEVGREVWSQQYHDRPKPRHFLCKTTCPKGDAEAEHAMVCKSSHSGFLLCMRAQYVCTDCFSVVYAQCHQALQEESKLRVFCGADHRRRPLYFGDSRDKDRTPMREPPMSQGNTMWSRFHVGRDDAPWYEPRLDVFAKARAALGGGYAGQRECEVGRRFMFGHKSEAEMDEMSAQMEGILRSVKLEMDGAGRYGSDWVSWGASDWPAPAAATSGANRVTQTLDHAPIPPSTQRVTRSHHASCTPPTIRRIESRTRHRRIARGSLHHATSTAVRSCLDIDLSIELLAVNPRNHHQLLRHGRPPSKRGVREHPDSAARRSGVLSDREARQERTDTDGNRDEHGDKHGDKHGGANTVQHRTGSGNADGSRDSKLIRASRPGSRSNRRRRESLDESMGEVGECGVRKPGECGARSSRAGDTERARHQLTNIQNAPSSPGSAHPSPSPPSASP